jgi:phosphoribosyl 1,2-cyclic phosphate phosphodiesterase
MMHVQFLGTGTSMGVPIAGGFGGFQTDDSRDVRYRTSCWVRTEKHSIVIDCGPEFRLQTLRAGITRIDLLLLTHEHYDHVAGLDDLRPFNFSQGKPIPVITHKACANALKRRFPYMFPPEKTPNSADLDLRTGQAFYDFEGERITLLPVDHQSVPVAGFRIRDFSYITDAKYVPKKTIELVRGTKVLVLNALRWHPDHPTHMLIPEAIELAQQIGAEQTYFVHMNAQVHHADTQRRLPPGIFLAYDNLEITV